MERIWTSVLTVLPARQPKQQNIKLTACDLIAAVFCGDYATAVKTFYGFLHIFTKEGDVVKETICLLFLTIEINTTNISVNYLCSQHPETLEWLIQIKNCRRKKR